MDEMEIPDEYFASVPLKQQTHSSILAPQPQNDQKKIGSAQNLSGLPVGTNHYVISNSFPSPTKHRTLDKFDRMRERQLFKDLNHHRNILSLAKKVMTDKKYAELKTKFQINFWYAIGVYKYKISLKLLMSVMQRHKKIGTMPKGYFYPELLQSNVETSEMQDFQINKIVTRKKI